MQQGADPMKTDKHGRTSRAVALFKEAGVSREGLMDDLRPPPKLRIAREKASGEFGQPGDQAAAVAGTGPQGGLVGVLAGDDGPAFPGGGGEGAGGEGAEGEGAGGVTGAAGRSVGEGGGGSVGVGGGGNVGGESGGSVGGESGGSVGGSESVGSGRRIGGGESVEKKLVIGSLATRPAKRERGAKDVSAANKTSGKFMADMLLTSSWLCVDEVNGRHAKEPFPARLEAKDCS